MFFTITCLLKGDCMLQVSVTTGLTLQWPPVATPVTDKDKDIYAFSIIPRSVILKTVSYWSKFQEEHAGQPRVNLSPLQLLLLVSSGVAKSPYTAAQIRQLFQDALCCLPPGNNMGYVPRLPSTNEMPAQPSCSSTLYMLK
jgi:hypothetical protein